MLEGLDITQEDSKMASYTGIPAQTLGLNNYARGK